jgi:hypothetical protein
MKDLESKSGVPNPNVRSESPSRQPRQQTDRATMFRVIRPSPTLLTATIILGTATFVAVPLLAQTLLAQNGEPSKPAEPGKGDPAKADPAKAADPAKTDPAKSDAKAEPGKAEAAKDTAGRPDESAETPRPLMGTAGLGECVRLGVNAVTLMVKDDLDTAFRHLELYDRFGCPGEHVQVSFRCVLRQGDIDLKDQKGVDFFNKRVRACWMNPALPAPPANPSTAAVEKPGTK